MTVEKLPESSLIKRDSFGRFVTGNNMAAGFNTSKSLTGRKLTPQHKINIGLAKRGDKHPRWKGGHYIEGGYPRILAREHPHADRRGYIAEHTLVAEKAIGRYLNIGRDSDCEVVHHINGNKKDNRRENLLICTKSYHLYLHARMSRLYQEEHFGERADSISDTDESEGIE